MKSKIIILLLLVVVLPTALLSWVGFQLARQQSSQMENRVRELMRDQLAEVDSRIKKYFLTQVAELQKTTSRSFPDIDSVRETADSVGIIDNIFIISANNFLAYPNPISPLNQRELDFYRRIKTIVEDGEIQNRVLQVTASSSTKSGNKVVRNPSGSGLNPSGVKASGYQSGQQNPFDDTNFYDNPNEPNSSNQIENQGNINQSNGKQQVEEREQQSEGTSNRGQSAQQLRTNNSSRVPQQAGNPKPFSGSLASQSALEVCEGWFIWYWGRGVNLIFWQRQASGSIVCVALERSRWMSDLIAELPDTLRVIEKPAKNDLETGDLQRNQNRSTRIVNSNADIVYQWGSDVADEMVLAAEVPVSHPLTSWKLQMWVMPDELKSRSLVGLNILLGIVASSIALVAVAWIFYREYTKDLQEASKRVSFVNQVSHELRTPLTNIRMYAELLRQQLDEADDLDADQASRRIEVVESECNRLSRLIGNVLTFAGSQKNKLEIRHTQSVIDDCVKDVISSFAPNLEKLQIVIHEDLKFSHEVRFDPDALGQMIGNLISNVEKYAANGEVIKVETRADGDFAEIRIQDGGPGVDPRHVDKIFEPFWRSSNELQHASGTGIGLSISRELARMHGGDLTLGTSSKGACFIIRIRVEKAS